VLFVFFARDVLSGCVEGVFRCATVEELWWFRSCRGSRSTRSFDEQPSTTFVRFKNAPRLIYGAVLRAQWT
jgi:hypothetical protein